MPENKNKVLTFALGTDHAGYRYKEAIKEHLHNLGHQTKDFGTFNEESVDYPEFITPAAEAVANSLVDYGIVLGGSGNGEAMAANKVKGVRCALCWSLETAKLAKQHNNANIVCIPARFISKEEALQIVKSFIQTGFEGGRHERRVNKI